MVESKSILSDVSALEALIDALKNVDFAALEADATNLVPDGTLAVTAVSKVGADLQKLLVDVLVQAAKAKG